MNTLKTWRPMSVDSQEPCDDHHNMYKQPTLVIAIVVLLLHNLTPIVTLVASTSTIETCSRKPN